MKVHVVLIFNLCQPASLPSVLLEQDLHVSNSVMAATFYLYLAKCEPADTPHNYAKNNAPTQLKSQYAVAV